MSEKAELRRTFKALRARVSPEVRAKAAEQLAGTVCVYEPFRQVAAVASFASFRDEIPTNSLVKALRSDGVRVVLPLVNGASNRMVMCDFSSLENLDRDRFGIRAPDGDRFTGTLDVVFIPGLAFGLDGSRLGYGGGFYDRFLASPQCQSALLCGLGYDFQVVESLPMEVHDVHLTHIATPDRIIRCSAG